MYNEALKQRFIQENAGSDMTRKSLTTVFNAIEKYEQDWNADCCTKTAEELQPMLNEVIGIRSNSRGVTMSLLHSYARWCLQNNVSGACRGMLEASVDNSGKIRQQMVQGPLQLQQYLNTVFPPEEDKTVDLVYRCYLWCAFIGLEEDAVLELRTQDVDLNAMTVSYGEKVYYLPQEAGSAFRMVVELESFNYSHKNYGTICRERNEGDMLLRGYKGETKIRTLRAAVTDAGAAAVKDGKTQRRLTYDKAKLSGLFYRIYERECNGAEPGFDRLASEWASSKQLEDADPNKYRIMRNKKKRELENDYANWKHAFML